MPLGCIVFDCDGVILESVSAKAAAFARLIEPYGPEAQARFMEHYRVHGGLSRPERFTWFYRELLGREISPEEMRELLERFLLYLDESSGRYDFVPGFQEVLTRWQGRVPLYVASGIAQKELENLLAAYGIASSFTRLFGTPPGKAALLKAALEHAGVHPSEAVMIGDTYTDQDAAERVGTLFYGRGSFFRGTGYPWHEDLTRFNDYLEALYKE